MDRHRVTGDFSSPLGCRLSCLLGAVILSVLC